MAKAKSNEVVEETKEVVTAPTVTAPTVTAPTVTVPSLLGGSPELMERLNEVRENLESVESMRLPSIKLNSSGMAIGDEIKTEVTGVLIHTRKLNQYYAKAYNKSEVTAPDCFSNDGIRPDASIKAPVSKACKGCPMAEFGTNSMKSGKACRNLKPVYLLVTDGSVLPIMPRQLTVPPTSLKEANRYLLDLTERGIAYRKVITKVTAFKDDKDDTYCKLKFAMASKLTDEQMIKDIEVIKENMLPLMNAQAVEPDNMSEERSAPTKGDY